LVTPSRRAMSRQDQPCWRTRSTWSSSRTSTSCRQNLHRGQPRRGVVARRRFHQPPALYSQLFQGRFPAAEFGWLVTAVGAATLRFAHGVVMWVILAFLIHHTYSVILIGTGEHTGTVASIVTGNKRFTEEYLTAAEDWAGD
jgi:hypothetical protein